MARTTPANLAIGILTMIFNVISSFFLLSGLKRERENGNKAYLTARHLDPLRWAVYFSCIYLVFDSNFQIIGGLWQAFYAEPWVWWLINNIIVIPILMLYIIRVWVIHYDYNSGIALYSVLLNGDRLIEDDAEQYEWFLENRENYGAPNYLYKFVAIVSVFLNIFLLFWSILLPDTINYVCAAVYLILILIGITITSRARFINDVFFIRNEILIQFRVLGGGFILIGIITVFAPVMGYDIAYGIILLILSIIVFGMSYISTWFVISKTESLGLSKELEKSDSEPEFIEVLKNPDTRKEFIEYLAKEIMVENLFFVADCLSFKQAFIDKEKVNKWNGFKCEVPTVLARLNVGGNFTQYSWAISKTYLEGDSSFLVTAITDETRNEAIEFYGKLKPSKEASEKEFFNYVALQTGFDKAIEEIWKELNQSYRRFSRTDEFESVRVQFLDK